MYPRTSLLFSKVKNFSLLKTATTNSLLKFKISTFDLNLYELSFMNNSSIIFFSHSRKYPFLCFVIINSNKYFPWGVKRAEKIEEEKEREIKQKLEEEQRIQEEERRLKEWEEKFDLEQKKKEEELIKKFYSDNSSNKTEPEEKND